MRDTVGASYRALSYEPLTAVESLRALIARRLDAAHCFCKEVVRIQVRWGQSDCCILTSSWGVYNEVATRGKWCVDIILAVFLVYYSLQWNGRVLHIFVRLQNIRLEDGKIVI